jgi:nicotinate-nucleotide adenylyltransferase
MNNRIIIFGGSFDPPHLGHKEIVVKNISVFKPQKTLVVPCGLQPLKGKAGASAEHRIKMLGILFKDVPGVEISECEICKDGCSYTIETILNLKNFYKKERLFFVMGMDSLETIHKWKQYEDIFKNVSIVVMPRNSHGDFLKTVKSVFPKYNLFYRSYKNIEMIKINGYKTAFFIKDFDFRISSTELRNGAKDDLESPEIVEYIKQNKLYRRN